MNIVQSTERPREAPDFPRQRARMIWLVTSAIIGAMHFAIWRPGQQMSSYCEAPHILVSLLAIAVFGYGLAAVITLLWTNLYRWKTVLWPIFGKFIAAFALAFVTPVAVLSGVPWIIGVLAIMFGSENFITFLWSAGMLGVAKLIWYPVASLIICGTRSHWLRFGLFCIMFWSCYAAHILYSGMQVFRF